MGEFRGAWFLTEGLGLFRGLGLFCGFGGLGLFSGVGFRVVWETALLLEHVEDSKASLGFRV